MPRERWRLIIERFPEPGPVQMARDEAHARLASASPPTLRFYRWSEPTVSIGRFQQWSIVASAREFSGFPLVRRPSGGRALLHGKDLSFAVTLPRRHSLAGLSVAESYRVLAGGLVRCLRALGLPAEAVRRPERARSHSLSCRKAFSPYEISCNSEKVVGSAQWRPEAGFLQHGSIFPSVVAGGWEEVARVIVSGLEEEMGIGFETGESTEEETALAEALAREKYGAGGWNEER